MQNVSKYDANLLRFCAQHAKCGQANIFQYSITNAVYFAVSNPSMQMRHTNKVNKSHPNQLLKHVG